MTSDSLQPQSCELIKQYTHLTGREARVQIYEYQLFDFFRSGFTCDEFVLVLTFLLRENKRNRFQYSLKLGGLITDHARFMDFLGEAKAKDRNRIKLPTSRESVLHEFRGVSPEVKGNCRPVAEVFESLRKATV